MSNFYCNIKLFEIWFLMYLSNKLWACRIISYWSFEYQIVENLVFHVLKKKLEVLTC